MARTLAILDDKRNKTDYDLLFTPMGIVAVKNGVMKTTVTYGNVKLGKGKGDRLIIDGKYEAQNVNFEALFALIQKLCDYSAMIPTSNSQFRLPNLMKLIIKNGNEK